MELVNPYGKRKVPGVEALERRLLMAGDVQAALRGDDLFVWGNEFDNQVRITQPSPGTVRVAGLEETTVNGRPFVDFANVADDIRVRMRQDGEDRLEVQGPLRIGGDLRAKIGDGELVVEGSAGPVQVDGELNASAGADGEVALRNEVVVGGDATVRGGRGATAAAGLGFLPDVAAARFDNPLDIDNPYFPLVPGTTYTYEERSVDDETGQTITERIVVEVTDETRTVMGVVNRVLRDQVFRNGLLIEDTRDWHAQDDNGNVWYFGEESTDFEYDERGNLIATSTGTSWEAGVDGAKPGIIMEAKPRPGDRYYQEFEPGVALDQGEVLAAGETLTLPGVGTFNDVVRTEDTTVLSPGALENKFYAPGLGLIQEIAFDPQTGDVDGTLRLVSAERNGQPVTQVVPPGGFDGVNAAGRGTGPLRVGGEASVHSPGPVVVREARFADEARLLARAALTVLDSTFEDELRADAVDGVGLRNVTVADEVLVRTDAGAYLFNSNFANDTEIRLGEGDDELVVGGSSFADLDADGGAGDNAFDDRGGNRFGKLELVRLER